MVMSRRVGAEFLGTFWLVFGGCGSAVSAAAFPSTPFVGVSFAFGLAVLTMAYAVGHISGGHFNPAATAGLVAAGRFKPADVLPYWAAQVAGAIAAAAVLHVIASSRKGFSLAGGFASNGYDALSQGKYGMIACLVIEVLATFLFLLLILGATSSKAPAGFAPIPIGLGLTPIHLISIPVTDTSVNPARSIGPALFAGGDYVWQLWLFILAPIVGAVLAGLVSKGLQRE